MKIWQVVAWDREQFGRSWRGTLQGNIRKLLGWWLCSLSWLWWWFQGYTHVKTYQIVSFKYVQFSVWQLCLNIAVFYFWQVLQVIIHPPGVGESVKLTFEQQIWTARIRLYRAFFFFFTIYILQYYTICNWLNP